MIDWDGFRENVGIAITNEKKQILIAKRKGQNAWQLPQGGIDDNESTKEALYRELEEEIGLTQEDVKIVAKTPKWLRYTLPKMYVRMNSKPVCIGQKQVWFLLKLISSEDKICLTKSNHVEFETWKWVNYWQPIEQVIDFKKTVYEDMLKALAPILFNNKHKVPKQYTRPLKFSAITVT